MQHDADQQSVKGKIALSAIGLQKQVGRDHSPLWRSEITPVDAYLTLQEEAQQGRCCMQKIHDAAKQPAKALIAQFEIGS